MRSVICNYCGQPAVLVNGTVIYPHRPNLSKKKFWQCAPCDAWVGCHSTTTTPLGRLANAELRQAKMAAHNAFDPIWQEDVELTRGAARRKAYAWLAEQMGLPSAHAHIGSFTVDQCKRVVELCQGGDRT